MDDRAVNPRDLQLLDEQGNYRADRACPQPVDANDELATLSGFLDRQRATLAWKCGGLDATALRTTLGSSPMTLGGLLKHLARFEDDMSAEWLLGQEQRPPWNTVDWATDHDWDWRSAADDEPARLYGDWQAAVNRCRAAFAAALTGGEREIGAPAGPLPSPRLILVNMIEEYARHNGHADLIRESIDGLVGQDPPNAS